MISTTTNPVQRDMKVIAIAMITLTAVVSGAMSQESSLVTSQIGIRAEFLADLDRLEQKFVGLAETIPAAEYSWRPANNVRTVSQALMHVAVGNYRILASVGITVPENIHEMEAYSDKEVILAELQSSIEAVRATVIAASDESLDEQVDFHGRSLTKRALFYLVGTHMHEHLGQTIAYARTIGVTPPWSTTVDPENG